MGMLGAQPVRPQMKLDWVKHDADDIADMVNLIAKNKKLTVDQALAVVTLAMRKAESDLVQVNGDYFDEQMGGFGELIRDANSNHENLVELIGAYLTSKEDFR